MPIGAALPVIGGALGGLLGGTHPTTTANVPADLQGLRGQNIGLLQQLLFGGQGGGVNFQGLGGHGFGGVLRGLNQGIKPNFNLGDPTNRLESFFGSLTSPLQRQALGGMQNFLAQPAPETRALDLSLPALQQILGNKPGQGIMDALVPFFQSNLASANQQGGRFSSGNATLRAQAVNDFNLLGAQAAQQGIQQQLSAADTLGMLSQAAGQNPFQRLGQATAFGDLEPNRRLSLLMQLLGTAQSATLGQPTTVSPSGLQQGSQFGFGIAQLLPWLGAFGGGGSVGKA